MEVRNGDEFLWTGFRNGDRLCLELLVKKHYALLYDYGKKFTGDQELVKDAIQELFLVLWKNRATIGETVSVRNYLFKALRRKIERLLNAKRGTLAVPLEFEHFLPANLESPELLHTLREEDNERSALVFRILGTLSRRQQEIIYLRFYLEADHDEIARIMGLSRQAVYNLLHLSIARLRRLSIHVKGHELMFLTLGLFFC